MSTGWNSSASYKQNAYIINLLGNEYWLELAAPPAMRFLNYKPTGK